ncbi:5165_t:CDS:2, partial [Scutellospora calospora]
FATQKVVFKTIYAKKQRQSKETRLIQSAEMRIGEIVGEIIRIDTTPEEIKRDFSEARCEELFNKEWEKVENDKKNFMRTMIMETKALEEHVVKYFNQAIKTGLAISNDENCLKERSKFNRKFWNKLVTPETLNKSEFLDDSDTKFHDNIKIVRNIICHPSNLGTYICLDYTEKTVFKKEVTNRIRAEIEDTCKQICEDLLSRNALAIEPSQALEWLKKLCNNVFIVQTNDFNQLKNPFKQYLRLKVFTTLETNACIAQSVKEIIVHEDVFSKVFEIELKNWMSKDRNPTRYAYEQSFGAYDVEKTPGEILKLIEKLIYIVLEKLGENILTLKQHFSTSLEKNLTLEKIMSTIGINDETNDLIESSWIDELADLYKKSLTDQLERSKQSYWNKVQGCRHRCPYCGSKCEIAEHEPNTNHRASIHFMVCFNGVRNLKSNEACLEICNEPKNFGDFYFDKNGENGLIFKEHTIKYYPEWWPLMERKQPDDDQIKQTRAMWMHLKDDLC